MKTGNLPSLPGQITQPACSVYNQYFWSLGLIRLPIRQVVVVQKATDVEIRLFARRFALFKNLVIQPLLFSAPYSKIALPFLIKRLIFAAQGGF